MNFTNDVFFNAITDEVYSKIEEDKILNTNNCEILLNSIGKETKELIIANLFRTNYNKDIQNIIARKIQNTLTR